jgi:hypothetical protein
MMDTSTTYQILIEGHLSDNWRDWFDGLAFHRQDSGDTLLEGILSDQAALHGILLKIRDLNLTLVAVKRIETH